MDVTYGPVRIVKGKYINQTGYYDDDAGSKAIVYLKGAVGFPNAEYIKVPVSYLEPIDNTLELARIKRDHPEVARILGIVTER